MQELNISIIGAGRVGTTMAHVLNKSRERYIKLNSIISRTDKSLNRAKEIVGEEDLIIYTRDLKESIKSSNCIIIATPDDLIEEVCNKIFNLNPSPNKNYFVIHLSGSKSLDILKKAREKKANTGCLHPIKSFASIEEAIKTLGGTVFGITYSNLRMKEVLAKLVKIFGGTFIEVDNKKKPLYHASACIASNYLVTLLNYAVEVNQKIGIKPEDSVKALMGLIEGTIENVKKMGTKESLTGPIARGDIGTIEEHLKNFSLYYRDGRKFYKFMGKETAKISYENGWINKEKFEKLQKILEG